MNNIWKNGYKIAKYSIIIGFLSAGLGITGFLTTNLITEPVLYTACAVALGATITGGVSLRKYNELEDLKRQIKDKTNCDEESYEEEPHEEPTVESLQEESFRKAQRPQTFFSFLRNLKPLKVIGMRTEHSIKKSEPNEVLVYRKKGDK